MAVDCKYLKCDIIPLLFVSYEPRFGSKKTNKLLNDLHNLFHFGI